MHNLCLIKNNYFPLSSPNLELRALMSRTDRTGLSMLCKTIHPSVHPSVQCKTKIIKSPEKLGYIGFFYSNFSSIKADLVFRLARLR